MDAKATNLVLQIDLREKKVTVGTHVFALQANATGKPGGDKGKSVKEKTVSFYSAPVTLKVNPAVSVTTTSLPTAVKGTAYSATPTASGGTGPFTWPASGLPAGLSVDPSTGAISGTPTESGSSTVTLTRTDTWSGVGSVTRTLTVNPALAIATTSLPAGVKGSAYSVTLAASGGVAPYTWSVSGLSANASTGVISGPGAHAMRPND